MLSRLCCQQVKVAADTRASILGMLEQGQAPKLTVLAEVLEVGEQGRGLLWIHNLRPGNPDASRITSCALDIQQQAELIVRLAAGQRPAFEIDFHVMGCEGAVAHVIRDPEQVRLICLQDTEGPEAANPQS